MITKHELGDSQAYQDQYYKSSVNWIMSLKKRHDPDDRIKLLPNDPQRYPGQSIDEPIIIAETPVFESDEDRMVLQRGILEFVKHSADGIMGPGNFDKYTDDIIGADQDPERFQIIQRRLSSPRSNISTVGFHPNVMALAIYSAGNAFAMSKAEPDDSNFNLFDFRKQNILAINPALAITEFNGVPTMDVLSATATLLKTPPPTKNTLDYEYPKELLKYMSRKGKGAMTEYLAQLESEGKSVWLTIDPTTSTISPIVHNCKTVALKRKVVNRPARMMLQDAYSPAMPVTMVIGEEDEGAKWFVGGLQEIETEEQFDDLVKTLDRETERLAGVRIVTSDAELELGKLAAAS